VLKPGDKAPDFYLKTDEGGELSLADFRGKRVLLFFFPKANTPG
jgi:peroxiredoxin Q/BCP